MRPALGAPSERAEEPVTPKWPLGWKVAGVMVGNNAEGAGPEPREPHWSGLRAVGRAELDAQPALPEGAGPLNW